MSTMGEWADRGDWSYDVLNEGRRQRLEQLCSVPAGWCVVWVGLDLEPFVVPVIMGGLVRLQYKMDSGVVESLQPVVIVPGEDGLVFVNGFLDDSVACIMGPGESLDDPHVVDMVNHTVNWLRYKRVVDELVSLGVSRARAESLADSWGPDYEAGLARFKENEGVLGE